MQPERPITPSSLSVKDLPWQIRWEKATCTLCGKCTAVCPVNAIELGVFRKRLIEPPIGFMEAPETTYTSYYGVRQKTDPAYSCVGCAMCNMVCPNNAIGPVRADEADKLRYHIDRGGQPRRRGEDADVAVGRVRNEVGHRGLRQPAARDVGEVARPRVLEGPRDRGLRLRQQLVEVATLFGGGRAERAGELDGRVGGVGRRVVEPVDEPDQVVEGGLAHRAHVLRCRVERIHGDHRNGARP